ncbi:MAG: ExbD/TolR family protein [Bacteriovoracia bacterium]
MFLRRIRKSKGKAQDHGAEVSLQITSLADILMVVLVFLLKSFSSGISTVENISVPKGIHLPEIQASTNGKDGIRVEIGAGGVSIDGQKLADLQDFRFPAADLNGSSDETTTSKVLIKSFSELKKDEAKVGKSVWVVADRRSPYRTIQTVLASAAVQGYSDFKLAVVKEE